MTEKLQVQHCQMSSAVQQKCWK